TGGAWQSALDGLTSFALEKASYLTTQWRSGILHHCDSAPRPQAGALSKQKIWRSVERAVYKKPREEDEGTVNTLLRPGSVPSTANVFSPRELDHSLTERLESWT